ncbi:hypothetical protein GCM10020001_042830 [Nonomuraea salmonea]
MARRDRLVMLTTLAVLQVLTIVIGVYAMTTDFNLSALTSGSAPTDPTASPAEGSPPSPWSPRGLCWPSFRRSQETDLSRLRVL